MISMKRIQKAKGILISIGLVCLLSLSFFLGGMAMARRSEYQAVAAAKKTLEKRSEKELVSKSEDFLDNSRNFAQELLRVHGEAPLLAEDTEDGDWECLESILNDVNAGNGARDAILAVCKESGLEAEHAQIKDLTEAQIMEADQETFCASKHPLGN